MALDPAIDDMEAHLRLLYDWTQTYYPHGCFEVRCIYPKGRCARSPNERFPCSPEGYQRAVKYAVRHNDQGYNIYVTANPLKPGTDHPAVDDDVEIAIHQFADADEVDERGSSRNRGKPRLQAHILNAHWQRSEAKASHLLATR